MSKSLLLPALTVLLPLLLLAGWWLYATVSEVGMMGLISAVQPRKQTVTVQLQEQPVYRIKKKQELMGVQVVRIVSRRQPEEFLVVNGVSSRMVDSLYGKDVDLGWANLAANQLLKLREGVEGDTTTVSVDVQEVKTVQSRLIRHDGQEMPYWQLRIRFQLSNEAVPRYYNAGVVRRIHPKQAKEGKDTLVIGYAQQEAYQPELIADLMDQLDFSRN